MNLINNSLFAYNVRRARRSIWTPAALFAEGQQGLWYEPKPEYLYQDAAGTIPVTADGDPVGLMLDRSRGMSASHIFSTTFDDTSGLVFLDGSVSVSGGKLLIDSTASPQGVRLDFQVERNKYYEITINIESVSEGSVYVAINNGVGRSGGISSPGTYSFRVFDESGTSAFPSIRANSTPTTAVILSWEIKQVAGSHAWQSVSAARPLYKTTGLLQQYDSVDDAMNITLPSIPAATVITAKATGVEVQYPVDLSAGSYTITESHSGIIIREGELSASEQQQAIDYLSTMQGVA